MSRNPLEPQQAARWLAAIPTRRSRRGYTDRRVPAAELDTLESLARGWVPWTGARVAVLREAPPAVFAGMVGAYGGVSGATSALVFICNQGLDGEAVGYTGEALVLEATALGLDTCWVAGLFRASPIERLIPLQPEERILAISALGYAASDPSRRERLLFGAGRPKARRSFDEIAAGHAEWPSWAQAAVSAARIAPSAMNRQPWRFSHNAEGLRIDYAGPEIPRTSKRLDCGIAMLHAEIGAASEGVFGRWESLTGHRVGLFRPAGR
jgi:hypothetical protein